MSGVPEFTEVDRAYLDQELSSGCTPIGFASVISHLNENRDPCVRVTFNTDENLSSVLGMFEMAKIDAVRHWNFTMFERPEEE